MSRTDLGAAFRLVQGYRWAYSESRPRIFPMPQSRAERLCWGMRYAGVKPKEPDVTKRIRRRGDADPSEGLQKYGDTRFADPTNKKYPIDTPGRIKAAWAYIHQPSNAAKYTAAERRTIQSRIKGAARARKVELPDPGEFVELMKEVRRRKRAKE